MAGLLDLFGGSMSEPQKQGLLAAAAQMLQASGPSLRPVGFGQVVGSGVGAYQQGMDAQTEREMLQQRMELMKVQSRREQQKLDMQRDAMDRFLGKGSSGMSGAVDSALAQGAAVGDFGPTVTNAGRLSAMQGAPAPASGGERGSLDALRAMAIAGVPGAKELFDIHKYENDPMKLEGGSFYQNRATGKREYIPKMDNGFTAGNDGSASLMPGYAEGVAALEGAKANATEGAKARYGTTVLNLPEGPRMVSNSELPQVLSGNWGDVSRKYKEGQPQRNAEQIRVLTDEYNNTSNEKDRQAIGREIVRFGGRVPGKASGPGIQLQDPVEQERRMREVQVGSDVSKSKQLDDQSAAKLYRQIGVVIPQAKALLMQDPTGSGAGALVDSALGFFGRATDSGLMADKLATIGGWLTSNVPRMEGPQSDADRKNYMEMAGRIGDRTLPAKVRLANLDALEKLVAGYAEARGQAGRPMAQPEAKVMTLSDIAATARASGRTTAEVTAAARAKGYTIGGQ